MQCSKKVTDETTRRMRRWGEVFPINQFFFSSYMWFLALQYQRLKNSARKSRIQSFQTLCSTIKSDQHHQMQKWNQNQIAALQAKKSSFLRSKQKRKAILQEPIWLWPIYKTATTKITLESLQLWTSFRRGQMVLLSNRLHLAFKKVVFPTSVILENISIFIMTTATFEETRVKCPQLANRLEDERWKLSRINSNKCLKS